MSLTLVVDPDHPGPEPFDFPDYRSWLVAWFQHRAGRPSMRGFARRARCSPTLVSQICRGHRNLGETRAEQWAPLLGLEGDAARFFLALVQWEESPSPRQRADAQRVIRAFKRCEAGQSEEAVLERMFCRWLYPVLHELARLDDFREDPQWIADRIGPEVDPGDVAIALEWMREEGLVGPDQEGRMRVINEGFTSERRVESSLLARALHETHLDLLEAARDHLPNLPAKERNYTMLTAALSQGQREAMLEALLELQRRVLLIATTDDGAPKEDVYQLSMQWFRITTDRA